MAFKINPHTDTLDYYKSASELLADLDLVYLRLDCSNDPLVSGLVINGTINAQNVVRYQMFTYYV